MTTMMTSTRRRRHCRLLTCIGSGLVFSNTVDASCRNYHDQPTDPDDGCAPETPLCVLSNGKQPNWQQEGAHCVAYPCVSTPHQSIDEGCTLEQPTCVDALGNAPRGAQQPGVQCIKNVEEKEKDQPPKRQPLDPSRSSSRRVGLEDLVQPRPWGLGKRDTTVTTTTQSNRGCWEEPTAGQFTFCPKCPFETGRQSCSLGMQARGQQVVSSQPAQVWPSW